MDTQEDRRTGRETVHLNMDHLSVLVLVLVQVLWSSGRTLLKDDVLLLIFVLNL